MRLSVIAAAIPGGAGKSAESGIGESIVMCFAAGCRLQ